MEDFVRHSDASGGSGAVGALGATGDTMRSHNDLFDKVLYQWALRTDEDIGSCVFFSILHVQTVKGPSTNMVRYHWFGDLP